MIQLKNSTCLRFVEPEKLADLRTKREIEVMNGRPWTRKLPPLPVFAALWSSGKNQRAAAVFPQRMLSGVF